MHVDQRVGGNVLQDVGLRSGLERPRDVLVGVVGRQHDHPRLRIARADPPHRFDAFHHRHPQVEQRHVGPVMLEGRRRPRRRCRLRRPRRRSGSWLMMLATPVRNRAWSSTTSTRALGARVAVDGLSRRHATSRSEATAAPRPARLRSRPRGAVTMVSDAPMRSARSCMLVMPKPAGRRSPAMPRPSSATDKPEADRADRRGPERDPPGGDGARRWSAPPARCRRSRARRCRQNAAARRATISIGISVRAPREIGESFERRGEVFAAGRRWAAARSPTAALRRCASGRARPRCRGFEATARRQRRRPRAARPAAASGWRQTPAPACRGCRARGGCAPRAWPCAAPRGGCARPRGSGAAPASPAGRSPESATPPLAFTRRRRPVASAIHPRLGRRAPAAPPPANRRRRHD